MTVSMDGLELTEDIPIYLQIIKYVKNEIAIGHIKKGDEMPSRRMLSALLGVNPNTIQKAYRFLEEEGIIQSHAGAKSYVMIDEEGAERIRQELFEYEIRQMIHTFRQMQATKEDAILWLERLWKEGEENEST